MMYKVHAKPKSRVSKKSFSCSSAPRSGCEYLIKSFSYSGTQLWNQLPSGAKNSTILLSFKAALNDCF